MFNHRIPPPSDELKKTVIAAAREAWESPVEEDVNWSKGLLRFAACLVASIVMVSFSNQASDQLLSEYRTEHDFILLPQALPRHDSEDTRLFVWDNNVISLERIEASLQSRRSAYEIING
jgi:hypothetical protein